MSELKDQLASLRIDRGASGSRRAAVIWLVVLAALSAGGYYAWTQLMKPAPLVVKTVRAQIMGVSGGPERIPVLTASGYIVARKKAVVSAKIQGRLSELRVEEGSRLKEGDVIARLESIDHEAQVERAKAAVERSEAELEENKRQLRLAESQNKEGIVSADEVDAAKSRTRISEAALRQSRADLGVYEAWLQNTYIRAPSAAS